MDSSNPQGNTQEEWTYPTRLCRICLEEVPATVTMYPPGLPINFQYPVVEYKNSDEYGRLVKPCLCKGGMRYIHELCLLQSRVGGGRPGAKWKCPTCGYQFNFQRLNVQKILESRFAVVGMTCVVLVIMMFVLGFVADPIINLYFDPYETLYHNDYWHSVDLNEVDDDLGWAAHFTKGFVTMGLVGFLKTLLANPWNWWNWRPGGMMGGRVRPATMGNTGRDRIVNVSWIAVVVGVCTAFYFFYQWIQSLVSRTMHRIGNKIVDTHLQGDDDDIKPPQGHRHRTFATEATASQTSEDERMRKESTNSEPSSSMPGRFVTENDDADHQKNHVEEEVPIGRSSGIDDARSQGWSFGHL